MTDRRLLPPMGAIHAFVEAAATENFSAAGTLVEVFAHRLKSQSAYWLVHAKGPGSPALSRFRAWLISQTD